MTGRADGVGRAAIDPFTRASYYFRTAETIFHNTKKEEVAMYQQDTPSVPAAPAQETGPQEFYLPLGGGIDPDLHVPEDRLHSTGRFSRWIQSLRTPVEKARKSFP